MSVKSNARGTSNVFLSGHTEVDHFSRSRRVIQRQQSHQLPFRCGGELPSSEMPRKMEKLTPAVEANLRYPPNVQWARRVLAQ